MRTLIALLIATAATTAAATPPLVTDPPRQSRAVGNSFWWPENVDLSPLRRNAPGSNPYGDDFNYAAAFQSLDLAAVKKDIAAVLTQSQPWWPADFGNYGPFFIRMAWHSAGTYRTADGRGGAAGGQLRFEPLNSWPDNANLDKARRLLWPVKAKYGRKISWADLMVLTGNVALEQMGFKTFGFAGGREDDWEADLVYWGPEAKMLADQRYSGDRQLQKPLAAVQMGLIYVNPEGPNGKPDPIAAARDIRETFGRMAMNDEETVALIAGGHTFGKAHGARKPDGCVGKEPAALPVEAQGLGWINSCGTGVGADAITSGLEGSWTSAPAQFTTQYLENLLGQEWVQTRSPAGAIQWVPKDADLKIVPDAHREGVTHLPIMFTTDLSLKFDPAYRRISERFRRDPKQFEDAFARAWFKLTHRDMGPRARYLGAQVPRETLLWQDPVPAANHPLVTDAEVALLKDRVLHSGLSVPQLVRAAWASASSFRSSDMRGGANGARVALSPQRDWAVNDPGELRATLAVLERIRADYNRAAPGGRRISMADMIVLAGKAGVEEAARMAGTPVTILLDPGRTDATQAMTDVASFDAMRPAADGFRNFYSADARLNPADMLVEKASQLNLTVPEMAVLVAGMRAMDANTGGAKHGVLTTHPGWLTNDFFVNLLSMDIVWRPGPTPGIYEGHDRATDRAVWTATPVDLLFGSHAELRAVAEAYASADSREMFARDFAKAWAKVMNLDRAVAAPLTPVRVAGQGGPATGR